MPSRTTRAKANRRLLALQEEPSKGKAIRDRLPAEEAEHAQEPSLGGDISQATFDRHAALLSDSQLSHSANAKVKAQVVRKLQSDYGNQYVQRLIHHLSATKGEAAQPEPAVGPAADKYEREADRASIGAASMSSEGRGAIAHERTHVVQQGGTVQLEATEDPAVQPLQRHSMEEAAEEEELIQPKRLNSSEAVQRKSDDEIKQAFEVKYDANDKTGAVNVLKDEYNLNAEDYDLSVAALTKGHAKTHGGWDKTGDTFEDITVIVRESYADDWWQQDSEENYIKLIHSLGHEYQHVEQRSKKGWRAAGDKSAHGEREFKAYSWEVLDAKETNRIPEMGKANTLLTIKKAKRYYAKMSDGLKETNKGRYTKLIAVETELKK